MNSLANLYAVFRTLQPELRAWLTSDEAMAFIGTIASEFVLSKAQERRIPTLILQLVTQDIPPESFKAALTERLGVSPDIASGITQAIHERIFSPIEQVLRFNGVDVNAIGFDAPLRSSDYPPSPVGYGGADAGQAPPVPAPMPTPAHELAPADKKTETEMNGPPPTPAIPAIALAQPFILHAEPKAAAPEPIKPSFTFTLPARNDSPRKTSAPKVVIERVVHYGSLTTPLNQPSCANPKRFL